MKAGYHTLVKKLCPTNPDVLEYFYQGQKIGAITLSDSSYWHFSNGRRTYAGSISAAEACIIAMTGI